MLGEKGAAAFEQKLKTEAAVKVKFENAPKGMRATVEPGSDAPVMLQTGYAMGAP